MTFKSKMLLTILTAILIIIFTPWFGDLYEQIIGRKITTWFIGPSHPEYIEGFFMSYMFFIGLFMIIFGGKNRYKTLVIFWGIVLLLDFMLGSWEGLIIDITSGCIGWIIGQGVVIFIQRNKQN